MVELRNANAGDHIRFVFSALLLAFSLVLTSYAILMQKTSFYDAVPGWAALLLFIVDLFLLGIAEGLQLALIELKRQHPDSYKKSHPRAYKFIQIATKGDNMERFLMGRQVCVVVFVFVAAKLTSIPADKSGSDFLFPVSWWFRAGFLETGLISCIVVVVLAQLTPQIIAAKYPVHCLQFLIMKPSYYVCIFVEMTGITHICWCLCALVQKVADLQDDNTTVNPVQGYGTMDEMYLPLNNTDSDHQKPVDNDTNSQGPTESFETLDIGHVSYLSPTVDEESGTVNPDILKVLHDSLNIFSESNTQFPSIVGKKLYPAPQALAELIQKDGHEIPKFLTDMSDPEHIPPHIVTCELLTRVHHLQKEIVVLRNKLEHDT